MLHASLTDKRLLRCAATLHDVWVVQGSAFDAGDLRRAGAHTAMSVMLFRQRLASDAEISLADADILCIYRYQRRHDLQLPFVAVLA